MSPVKLTTILKNQVGEVRLAKVLRDGNLLIMCSNEEQRERACRMREIGNKVISARRVEKRFMWNRGVIWAIPVEVTMDEIKANVKGGKVKDARRLQTFRDGIKQDSESVMLEFEDEILPNKVTLGYMTYNVREFVPKPMRCFNCQRFGHSASTCKRKRRCARCGEDRDYEQCRKEIQPKCCNCGGSHSVASGGCEVMKRQVEIQQIRVQNKISYADAVKMVNVRGESDEENVNDGLCNKQQERPKEGKTLIDLKKLIIFMAGVINATTESKSKTERIQIIVKAAVNHLGFTDLSWEEVELSAQASQEASFVG